MITLSMIVSEVRVDDTTEGAFTHHDHPFQGLILDGADEPFAVGIQIRAPGRQDDRFYAAGLQEPVERLRELRIPVVEQIAFAQQESIKGIGQLPGALLHEGARGMGHDTGNLHSARR